MPHSTIFQLQCISKGVSVIGGGNGVPGEKAVSVIGGGNGVPGEKAVSVIGGGNRVPGEKVVSVIGGGNRVPGENWQTLSHIVVSSTPRLSGVRTHNASSDRYWLHC